MTAKRCRERSVIPERRLAMLLNTPVQLSEIRSTRALTRHAPNNSFGSRDLLRTAKAAIGSSCTYHGQRPTAAH